MNRILLRRYLVQIAYVTTQVDSHRNRPVYEKVIIKICKVIPIGKLINAD